MERKSLSKLKRSTMVSNLMFPMSLKVLYTNKIWKNNDFTLLALMLIIFYKNFGYFIVFLKKHCCNFFISVDLRSIGVANASIIVDRSAPVPGNVYDGETAGQDLMYTKDQDKVMPNIQFLYNAYIHDQQFVWFVCLFVHTFNFSPNI